MLIDPQKSVPEARVEGAPGGPAYPDNPILVRHWRGGAVESVHRGIWALVDPDGHVIDGVGAFEHPIFARSSTKALQALPLLETGAADRFGFGEPELALAVASHNGERCHTDVVQRMLASIELEVGDLRCGAHRPYDRETWEALRESGHEPTQVHNNCSGKHAGFLALGKELGDAPADYLDLSSGIQRSVQAAVVEMTGVNPDELGVAIDGCSAPTFRLPLRNLAQGFARFANPSGLAPERSAACQRIADAVAANPDLIGATRNQICSAIARATGGRLFPKIGAEAVYVIGDRGGDRALAIKMDDGSRRGLHPLILHLLERFDLASEAERRALEAWAAGPIRNWAGLDVGRTEVVE